MRIAAFVATFAFFFATSPAVAGEVRGVVYDAEGVPAAGVTLTFADAEIKGVTGADGSYRFAEVPAGEHKIAVSRGASAVQYVPLRVGDDAAVVRNVFLLSAAYVEEEVAATSRMNAMIAEALELAEAMGAEGRSGAPAAWRWGDHEG